MEIHTAGTAPAAGSSKLLRSTSRPGSRGRRGGGGRGQGVVMRHLPQAEVPKCVSLQSSTTSVLLRNWVSQLPSASLSTVQRTRLSHTTGWPCPIQRQPCFPCRHACHLNCSPFSRYTRPIACSKHPLVPHTQQRGNPRSSTAHDADQDSASRALRTRLLYVSRPMEPCASAVLLLLC